MYKTYSSGLLSSNTYVVCDDGSHTAMIVDCGNPVRNIRQFCEDGGLNVKYIVLTHSHYDHANFLPEYKEAFPSAEVVCHEREVALMNDSEANVSLYFGTPTSYGYPDKTVREGDVLTLGDSEYRVLSTPGHTPGSICLYNKDEKLMLTGDTLFEHGWGRCDFKYGSEADMYSSLKRLLSMDADITFLAGHGGESKIGREKGMIG